MKKGKTPHLVLTRNPGESIVLEVPGYPPVTIKVGLNNMRQVKLRIGAHRDIMVHREEIYELRKSGNSQA